MWDCRYCAQLNRKKWRAHILEYLNSPEGREKIWSFNTLTVPSWIHDQGDKERKLILSLQCIRSGWEKFIKRMKRKYGNFSYIRVIEMHKSGVLHVHFLASFHYEKLNQGKDKNGKDYSYNPDFKKDAVSCGFGYICNNQNVVDGEGLPANAGYVAGYITKYMTKQSDAFATAVRRKRVRRVLVTQDIKSPSDNPSLDEYWLWKFLVEQNIIDAENSGRYWVDLNTGAIISTHDFEYSDFYPDPLE